MNTPDVQSHHTPPTSKLPALESDFFLSITIVAFLTVSLAWGFWTNAIISLGLNATIILLSWCHTLALLTPSRNPFARSNLLWSVPLTLTALSYGLYDNYFIKLCNLLVIPLMTGVLFLSSRMQPKVGGSWSMATLFSLLLPPSVSMFLIPKSALLYGEWLGRIVPRSNPILKRVALGLFFFSLFATVAIVPLLGTAEPIFAQYLNTFFIRILKLLKLDILIAKTFIFCALALGMTCFALAIKKEPPRLSGATKSKDQIVGGILLCGIFLLYSLFLGIQIQRLFVGLLPVDFGETERLVKTGFWQLMILSTINISLVVTYRLTAGTLVLNLLRLFVFASLLLLGSAAYRMGLYVTYYGFSHEKFFATYSVLYCAVLLVFLVITTFTKPRDTIKFGTRLFVIMYSLVSVLPVETFILRSNIALSHIPASRIDLADLHMLSPDVLSLVEQYVAGGELPGSVVAPLVAKRGKQDDWTGWIMARRAEIAKKEWYEMSLGNLIYVLQSPAR